MSHDLDLSRDLPYLRGRLPSLTTRAHTSAIYSNHESHLLLTTGTRSITSEAAVVAGRSPRLPSEHALDAEFWCPKVDFIPRERVSILQIALRRAICYKAYTARFMDACVRRTRASGDDDERQDP